VKKPKLFVDEDACNHVVVSALRRLGIDLLTVPESGRLGGDDADQLRFAASLERAFYSLNVSDFMRIHSEFMTAGEDHWGIILIPRQRHSIGAKIQKLHELLEGTTADQLRNTIHFV
jgi:hypothetical protein